MTKEHKEPHSFLQKWRPVTERELVTELETLAIHFPRTDMDARKWQVLFQTFAKDFHNKSLEEVRYGCRRYRQNPENRFFPTPGQLLEACKNPFDTKERKYAELEDLPPAMSKQNADTLIERIRKKYAIRDPGELQLAAVKEEILQRPPIEMTPELKQREKALAEERRQALQRALEAKEADRLHKENFYHRGEE